MAHLSEKQRIELTAILDQFQDCFTDVPGFCDLVEHDIPISDDFKPKRFRAYKVRLKAEVDRQIQELLSLGFIRPSKSQMASPLVCVLKGKDGQRLKRSRMQLYGLCRSTAVGCLGMK